MNEDLEYLDFVIEGFSGNIGEDYSGLFIDIMLDNKKIGSLEGIMFFDDAGDINSIFESIDEYSMDCTEIAQQIFIPSKYCDGDYTLIWDEVEEICFKLLIIERIFIEEEYRGMGIMKILVRWIKRVFDTDMVLKAYPLQYCSRENSTIPKSGFAKAKKKVVDAYLKSGFKRIKPKSDILYADFFEYD